MKERPILFKGPLVRAILEGRKTVTRREVKGSGLVWLDNFLAEYVANPENNLCPYGNPGDRLWVRETWARVGNCDPGYLTFGATYPDCLPPELENIPAHNEIRWKPSIHMFRRDSRILLEITAVRIERLQDVTEEQARAEGITDGGCLNCGNNEPCGCDCPTPSAVDSFCYLWNEINGAGAWEGNPWVWVISFRRVES